jgi:hypothetical protein
VLSLKSNNLRSDGGKALAEGLKGNQVITELNIADNNLTNTGNDMSGVIALADVIPDMGGLSVLNLASNNLGALVLPAGWTHIRANVYRHIDGREQSDNPRKPEGIIAIANAIPDMRALSTVIVNTFRLPIQDIRSKAELDFSGKGLKVEDAIIIAALIPSTVSRTILPHPCYH